MSSSSIWAILPVKRFDDAKSRLQPVLDAPARGDLARVLMLHSLQTLSGVRGIERVLVVSSDPAAWAAAHAARFEALPESGAGLNAALTEARDHALRQGAGSLLVLACDLPRLSAGDIEAMLSAGREGAGLVIAPDRGRRGTNALLLRPADAVGFSFGESSFQRHVDQADAAGLATVTVSRPGLAFDIDLPEDWLELQSGGWSGTADEASWPPVA